MFNLFIHQQTQNSHGEGSSVRFERLFEKAAVDCQNLVPESTSVKPRNLNQLPQKILLEI